MNNSRRAMFVGAVLVLPVVVGFGYALLGATDAMGVGATGMDAVNPSLARMQRVFAESAVWRGTVWAVWVSLASTLLAASLAVFVALVFSGTSRTDRSARALMNIPLAFSHLVAATVGLLILGQSGMLARLMIGAGFIAGIADVPELVADRYGIGVILTLMWKEAPFLLLVNIAVLQGHGVQYGEVARTHGGTRAQVFRRITWPLLWRGLSPALVAVATFAFGSYETMVLLAPSNPLALPLLTAERYVDPSLARRNDAFVLALLGIAIGMMAVVVHEAVRSRVAETADG